ncbi:Golgi transport complex subunit 6 [Massospora cicadina]|nr:Golgi transport complex subunit 6 [Massospora cicadina]
MSSGTQPLTLTSSLDVTVDPDTGFRGTPTPKPQTTRLTDFNPESEFPEPLVAAVMVFETLIGEGLPCNDNVPACPTAPIKRFNGATEPNHLLHFEDGLGTPFQLRRKVDRLTRTLYTRYLERLKALDESCPLSDRVGIYIPPRFTGGSLGITFNPGFFRFHIAAIETNLKWAAACCQEMEAKWAPTRSPAQMVLKEVSEFDARSSAVQKHLEEVEAFLGKYTLTSYETAHLYDRSRAVDGKFMEVVDRLGVLEAQLSKLGGQGEILGQDLLNNLTAYREEANLRLETHLRQSLPLLEVPLPDLESEGGQLLCVVGKMLKRQPSLLAGWLDQVAKVRQAHLTRELDAALTRGPSYAGGARPNDPLASEPLNHVGDGLTWMHQALVEESQLLAALIASPGANGDEGLTEQLASVLDAMFSSAILRLDGEVRRVLESLESPAVAFQIANLIAFHRDSLSKTQAMGEIHSILHHLTAYAMDRFDHILEDALAQLLSQAEVPPADLNVPKSIVNAVDDLKRLLNLSKSSYNPSLEVERRMVDGVLDPLIQLCDREATFVEADERAIYVINCLTFIQTALTHFPAAQPYVERLGGIVQSNVDQLLELQCRALLKLTGLDPMMPLADSYHELLEGVVANRGEEASVHDLIGLCLDQHLATIVGGLSQLEQFLYTVDLDQDFTIGAFSRSEVAEDGDAVGLKRLRLPLRAIWRLRSQALKHLLACYSLLYPLLAKVVDAASKLPIGQGPAASHLVRLQRLRLRPVTELETLLSAPDL